ncbi:hypothetical protein CY35_05G021100 [Sphagnum magellanicum]|nr:hypothetical protein CY35_05G021100 [Sphagnum magellanicum]
MQKNPSMATPLSSALHLCKGIREEYSHISVGHLCPLAINRQQCMLLLNKVLETENTLKPIQVKLSQQDTTSSGFPNVGPATEELVHVLRAAHTTIFKDCFCNGRWMESALRQGGDLKETFAEILYDLQWYMMVLRSIFPEWTFQDSGTPPSWLLQQVDCDRNLSERDNDSLLKAAKQDQEDLKFRLGNLKGNHACHGERCSGMDINEQCLASQLLNKMEFEEQFQALPAHAKKNYHEKLHKVDGIKLGKWPFVVLANLQDLHKGLLLGSGSFGSVHEANWLGESYAMKIPKHPSTELLKQEIAAVAGVHHPHIMGIVFCAKDAKDSVYVMERMDKSLSEMLRDQSSDNQLSLIGRVGVMLQVAEGMKYLHSKGLVHRDLKTDNILIKCDGPGSDLVVKPLWIAKISDFGTTKVKMDSTAYANQTMNTGTTIFMAPEMYAGQRADQLPERCHPKKADVYSFGLICFAVLIGEPTPFPVDELLRPTIFKDRVREGKRPQLPHYCPSELSNLIQQCWDGNPDKRPNFQEICTKLRHIKGLLLTEGSSPEAGNLLASRVSTSSSIQERTYRAYSGEDTSETLAITLSKGVPGVRTTLRGQEDSLRSRVSPAERSRASLTERYLAAMEAMSPMERYLAMEAMTPMERSRAAMARKMSKMAVVAMERSRAATTREMWLSSSDVSDGEVEDNGNDVSEGVSDGLVSGGDGGDVSDGEGDVFDDGDGGDGALSKQRCLRWWRQWR